MAKKHITEIRINHKSEEEKNEYELKLNEALIKAGYKSRVEFIQESIRNLIKEFK